MSNFLWKPKERPHCLVNGELTQDNDLPNAMTNRGFLYSDGFFETIRICNGIPQFIPLHWNRIASSLSAYRIENSQNLTLENLFQKLLDLCQINGIFQGGRVRITFFRSGGGRYRPESNEMGWIATSEALDENLLPDYDKGFRVDVFSDMKKLSGPFANFKNLASSLYVQAGLWAQDNDLDDALIQNQTSHIIESSHSNLFLVSNGVLYTPSLDSGPVGGIMRAAVINSALEHGYKVYECEITPKEMLQADEMFLTNAIRGVQWVASYQSKRYFHATAKQMTQFLNAGLIKTL
jgi:branched-chain amino acid aminotransferase|tara:strand:+ start:1779 stop:2657 length:879 start_codon:yes stop_codon:yes gene_type:complete